MSATSQDVYNVLLSIDRTLKALLEQRGASSAPAVQPPVSLAVSDDRDLDSPYGDEEIKVSPRDWSGPPMKGARMSACPPEFLDMLAETFEYFARKNAAANAMTTGGKPKADFDRRSAARARGWAARLRRGWQAPGGSSFDENSGGTDFVFNDRGATDDGTIPF